MDEQRKAQIRAEIEAKLQREAAIRAEIDAKLLKELKAKELELLKSKANKGDVNAQFKLAECFYNGFDVEQNQEAAIVWYTKAAESGHLESQKKLYDCYINGKGVDKDINTAFKWLTMAADCGDAEYQNELANRYKCGINVEIKHQKAFHYYQLAAKQGVWQAYYELGNWCYLLGNGTKVNYEKSVFWLKKAIDNCDSNSSTAVLPETKKAYALALWNFGKQLEQSNSIDNAKKRAFECYKESAEYGNVPGIAYMGHCYQYGIGIEQNPLNASDLYIKAMDSGFTDKSLDVWMKELEDTVRQNNNDDSVYSSILSSWFKTGESYFSYKQNYKSAIEWYTRAAECGSIEAQKKLYNCLYNGIGVAKDIALALEWLEKAAENGDVTSQYEIANKYAQGTEILKDVKKAFHYYSLAVDQGSYLSKIELGKCYLYGEGVGKNMERASFWLDAANKELSNKTLIKLLAEALAKYGLELEKNNPDADTKIEIFKIYKDSADYGNCYGIAYLGHCYHHGIGTEVDLFKADEQYQEAKELGHSDSIFEDWLKELEETVNKQAENGDAFCQGILGAWYLTGSHGEENEDKAFEWLSRGAKQGNGLSLYYLGEYYEQKEDYEKAFVMYKKSAPLYGPAMVALGGICYLNGNGVKQDVVMAKYWLDRAYNIEGIQDEVTKNKYESAVSLCSSLDSESLYNYAKNKLSSDPASNKSLFQYRLSLLLN